MEHSGSKEGCQFALRWVSRGFSFPGTTFNLKMFLKMSGRVYQLVISTILHVSKLFGLSAGFPLELVYPWSPHLSVQFCFCWPAVGLGPTNQPASQPTSQPTNQPASHASQSLPLPLAPCLTGGKLFVQKHHNTS